MSVITIGLDLAKSFSRCAVLIPPATPPAAASRSYRSAAVLCEAGALHIRTEACSNAHHRAWELMRLGHQVRPYSAAVREVRIPPRRRPGSSATRPMRRRSAEPSADQIRASCQSKLSSSGGILPCTGAGAARAATNLGGQHGAWPAEQVWHRCGQGYPTHRGAARAHKPHQPVPRGTVDWDISQVDNFRTKDEPWTVERGRLTRGRTRRSERERLASRRSGGAAGCRANTRVRRCCVCCVARILSWCRAAWVTVATLSGWRGAFLAAGEAALTTRPASGEELKSERLKAKPALRIEGVEHGLFLGLAGRLARRLGAAPDREE